MISGVTAVKNIADIHTIIQLDQPTPGQTGSNEMNSNANTCCSGKNILVLELNHIPADVYPYGITSYKPLYNVLIVSTATVYDDPTARENFILVLNECL